MLPARKDSLRLFRVFGIDVYLHWSWVVIAFLEIDYRRNAYSSLAWEIAEYVSLFAIVLIHEFGHALACRQVGGRAEQILLWPLGGVAFVAPPQRPGAQLWSIAAGPLVNVGLFFVFSAILLLTGISFADDDLLDWQRFLATLWKINLGLLLFNLIPVYPLDGGQILRSLLWFLIGPVRSMYVAVGIGFVGVAGLAMWAVSARSIWIGVIGYFIFMNCLRGLAQARALGAQIPPTPQ
jgi:Zn-dependent protease